MFNRTEGGAQWSSVCLAHEAPHRETINEVVFALWKETYTKTRDSCFKGQRDTRVIEGRWALLYGSSSAGSPVQLGLIQKDGLGL